MKKAAVKTAAKKSKAPSLLLPVKQITAWSFSRWTTHSGDNGCPYKAKLKFIEKRNEPKGPAMERGTIIHKMAEDVILKPKMKIPAELKYVAKEFGRLRALKAQPELELAVTKDWKKTDWFGPLTWLRIKIDAIAGRKKDHSVVEAVDWKTGQYKPDSKDYDLQLELYGGGVLSAYEHVDEVVTRLVFTDHPQKDAPPREKTFTRDDAPRLVKLWNDRAKPMLADTRFAPRPGWYCRYCHFRKENGGPCKY